MRYKKRDIILSSPRASKGFDRGQEGGEAVRSSPLNANLKQTLTEQLEQRLNTARRPKDTCILRLRRHESRKRHTDFSIRMGV